MNNLFNKTIAVLSKVFFNAYNKIEKLPEKSEELAGQYVLKIHPKGYVMQLRLYNSKGRPEFDIDLHDHDEEKEYTHGGIHIHEYKWRYEKRIKRSIYERQSGRNLTNDEYVTYIKNLDFSKIKQIQVRYI